MRASASGQLAEGGRLSDVRAELSAPDLAVLLPGLTEMPGSWQGLAPLLRGPGAATLTAAGTAEALATRLTLELGDLRIEAKPVVNLPAQRATGPITLHHPGAPRLLETLGAGQTASWLGDGSFSLLGVATAMPGRVEIEGATLSAGSLRASGRAALDGRRLTAQVAADTLPLPLPYWRSPDPLPVAWLRNWQASLRIDAAQVLVGLSPVLENASTELSLDGGVLLVRRAVARVAGGGLAWAGSLDARADPPRMELRTVGVGLSVPAGQGGTAIELPSGQLGFFASLAAAGHSPAALLATLSGTATGTWRDGVIEGFDLAGARAALTDGDQRAMTRRRPRRAAGRRHRVLGAGCGDAGSRAARPGCRRGCRARPAPRPPPGRWTCRTPGWTCAWTCSRRWMRRRRWACGSRDGGTPVRVPELAALARWAAEHPRPAAP